MKTGFTLIELLAVIVILALIALIATPIVLKIINNTKESSAERSLELYKETVENAVERYQLKKTSSLVGGYSTTDDGKRLYLKSDATKTPIDGLFIEYTGSTVSCETVNIDAKGKIQYFNCKVSNKIVASSIPYICKRATTLHTEICEEHCYCRNIGYTDDGLKGTTTITYGSLGTKGKLTPGDAFDCDVNGDGIYNATTERFYYVSGKDGDNTSNYVTLIYYNNISGSIPDNTPNSLIAYDSSNENWHGPITAISKLPKTTDWSNIKLLEATRAIKNELGGSATEGGTLPTSFSYSGYASRLLTVQEINKACNIIAGSYVIGELDTCIYLIENTDFSKTTDVLGYWLETPNSENGMYASYILGSARNVDGTLANISAYAGVRPAIVIPKSDISY